jgi:hypothetical protein
MRNVIISFGLASRSELGPHAEDEMQRRREDIYGAVFSWGPAWTGGQAAVFVQTDISVDEIMDRLLPLVGGADSLLAVEIDSSSAVRYAGWLVDAENFEPLFPGALRVGQP